MKSLNYLNHPFPTAAAVQAYGGWARGLGVNLLVANQHHGLKGTLGSGIFQPHNST